jgi:hypothetical protein
MAFSQATITDVSIKPIPERAELWVNWTSSSPDGTTFQVYADRRLAWHGVSRSCVLPWPRHPIEIEVGTVAASEAQANLSASLPAALNVAPRATLTWFGGRYLDPGTHDVVGFRIYQAATTGGAVDYGNVVGFVPFSQSAQPVDGYGRGRFGRGRFGFSEVSYRWQSEPLTAGTWAFGVKPIRAGGIEGTAAEDTVVISRPPSPPAPNANGSRLSYSYNAGTRVVTLSWNASP